VLVEPAVAVPEVSGVVRDEDDLVIGLLRGREFNDGLPDEAVTVGVLVLLGRFERTKDAIQNPLVLDLRERQDLTFSAVRCRGAAIARTG